VLYVVCLVLAYFLGAIPTSYWIARRVAGIDLREHGSGNLGATNVFRTLGGWWGGLVLLLDMLKGAVPVLLMSLLLSTRTTHTPLPLHLPPDVLRITAGFVAAIGHTLSPFVGFHGGKGISTTAGAFAVLAPYPLITVLVVWGIAFAFARIVSLASLCATIVLPVAVAFFEWRSESFSKTIFGFTLVIVAWVLFKHRANIRRLADGTESQLREGKRPSPQPSRASGAGAGEPRRTAKGGRS
jgi:glycerol-3-phosphate acyltransferase PlsY